MPRVSIITPYYKGEDYIGRAIGSIRVQTFADWEHVIVDDGSPTELAPIAAPYLAADPRLRLLRQANGGRCNARNSGFANSSPDSEYLLFLDQDDCLEADMLAVIVDYLDLHPEVGMAFSDRTLIDEHDDLIDAYRDSRIARFAPARWGVRRLPYDSPNTSVTSLFGYSVVVPSGAVLRRSVYKVVGGWDESLGCLSEDTDLWMRIALHSPVHYVPQKLLRRRLHSASITRSASPSIQREAESTFQSKWRPENVSPEYRPLIEQAWRFREGRLLPFLWFTWGAEHLRQGHFVEGTRCFARCARQLARHGAHTLRQKIEAEFPASRSSLQAHTRSHPDPESALRS